MVEHCHLSASATRSCRDVILRGVVESEETGVAAANVASQIVRPLQATRRSRSTAAADSVEDARAAMRLAKPSVREGFIAIIRAWIAEAPRKRRAKLWRDVFGPLFRDVWPRDLRYLDTSVSEEVARLASVTDSAFPEAVRLLGPYIVPLQGDYLNLHWFVEDDCAVARRFPGVALELLWACCRPPCTGRASEIGELIEAIVSGDAALALDRRVEGLRRRSVF